ncbi:Flp family type IVb pilin [Desulfovibrio mangrovi]|uniref:Flp family type IVb pilin n=1 Tax=Desulfovibrio mangrovi TaxID=2976983 RepID=UPI002246657B|nr:Flp family type IVb pilin [Desulfovibrio mangrovi]UZP65898.1 Flp family type IVb pilin [Desulfovibrio mangrovi]UZP65899.1 Flp family type IVb pilin [Desulfovibrio mangrovi]
MRTIKNFIREEEGATALEYGLLAALIAGVLTAAVTLLGGNIRDLFNRLAGDISGA